MTVLTFILPIFIAAFYLENYFKWEEEEFDAVYGAAIDGLNKQKKMSILYPVYFVVRRVCFVLTAMLLPD